VAKKSTNNRRPAPARPPVRGGRPAPARPPVRARGGRPAGLFTWIAVGLVVLVVAALVIIKVATGSPTTGGKSSFSPISAANLADLTTVPASVFNTVGVTSPIAQVSPPDAVKAQPSLTATNSAGATVPEIVYVGAEYCPYCAAQRWATIIALSRFGTFSGLGNMSSYYKDVFPNTPTFTFVMAKYKSKYLVFKTVEEYTNYLDAAGTYYEALQKPTAQEIALIKKYDRPKYIPDLTASEAESIPFIDFGNQFLVAGASYSPTTLAGSTRNEIAAGLSNATSPVTQAIIASANYQTATICSLTKNMPSTVCTSSGVEVAAKAMGLK
jgi:thiol-disulfide isomerase/thioredoxin